MFVTYPDVRYLSGCSLPIRIVITYPDVQCLEVARLISGRRVACPPAVRATSFARRVDALSDQAPQATRRPPGGGARPALPSHGHSSFARNSSEDVSNIEIRSLKLRGFRAVAE